MRISALIAALATFGAVNAVALADTPKTDPVARDTSAAAVVLEAPRWTRVTSRDKKPGQEWGGWGGAWANTPWRFEFKKKYLKESFTLETFPEAAEWHDNGSGGWFDDKGPQPTPEHTLHVSGRQKYVGEVDGSAPSRRQRAAWTVKVQSLS
jgi:hypothetical protein